MFYSCYGEPTKKHVVKYRYVIFFITAVSLVLVGAFPTPPVSGDMEEVGQIESLQASTASPPEREVHVSDQDAEYALRQMAKIIHGPLQPSCEVVPFGLDGGANYGRHDLCKRQYATPCLVLAYGVHQDYTFEMDVRKRGLAALYLR